MKKQCILIFLDAEKDFDHLNWTFWFRILKYMSLRHNFIKQVRSIYASQKAEIIVNGKLTKFYEVQKKDKTSKKRTRLSTLNFGA